MTIPNLFCCLTDSFSSLSGNLCLLFITTWVYFRVTADPSLKWTWRYHHLETKEKGHILTPKEPQPHCWSLVTQKIQMTVRAGKRKVPGPWIKRHHKTLSFSLHCSHPRFFSWACQMLQRMSACDGVTATLVQCLWQARRTSMT